MAIFTCSLLKSPIQPTSARTIPNGGLGGFVEFPGLETSSGQEQAGKSSTGRTENREEERGQSRVRKQPPPPIQINGKDLVEILVQSAPYQKDKGSLSSATLRTGSNSQIKTAMAAAFVIDERDFVQPRERSSKPVLTVQTPSQPEQGQRQATDMTTSASKSQTKTSFPVELPGSLLLPDQGFAVNKASSSSSSSSSLAKMPSNRQRAYTELPATTSSGKLSQLGTAVSGRTPDAREEEKKSSRSSKAERKSELPPTSKSPRNSASTTASSTSISPNTSKAKIRELNVLSANDLIRVLPQMKPKKLATHWLPAMEKEIGKYRGFLDMYSNRTWISSINIKSICTDLLNVISTMKKTASLVSDTSETARADIDTQSRTVLEKLINTQEELAAAQLVCSSQTQDIDIHAQEFQHLKHVLCEVVATLGDCTRNYLAYELYHSDEGLSNDVVRTLKAYKHCDDHVLDEIPSTVSTKLYETLHTQTAELQRKVNDYQSLIAEQQRLISQSSKEREKLRAEMKARDGDLNKRNILIQVLEDENAALRKQVLALQNLQVSPVSNVPRNDVRLSKRPTGDMATMFDQHTEELEVRDTFILQQNVVIEDLIRRVDNASEGHFQLHSESTSEGPKSHSNIRPARKAASYDQYQPTRSSERRLSHPVGQRYLEHQLERSRHGGNPIDPNNGKRLRPKLAPYPRESLDLKHFSMGVPGSNTLPSSPRNSNNLSKTVNEHIKQVSSPTQPQYHGIVPTDARKRIGSTASDRAMPNIETLLTEVLPAQKRS